MVLDQDFPVKLNRVGRGIVEGLAVLAMANQWLSKGAEEMVMELLARGKISKGRAVEVLDSTYHEVNQMLEDRGIRVGPSEIQVRESIGTAGGWNHGGNPELVQMLSRISNYRQEKAPATQPGPCWLVSDA